MEEKGSRKGRRRRKSREALVDLSSSDPAGGADGKKAEPSRVLLDVIRDGDPNAGGYRSLLNHDKHKKNWKVFKDRLRLKRASQAWISALPDEGRRHPLQLLPPEVAEDEEESGSGGEEPRRAGLRPQLSRLTSFQPPEPMRDDVPISDPPLQGARRPQMMRRNSSRLGTSNSIRQRDDPGPRVRFADQLAAEKEQIQRVVSSVQAYRDNDEVEEEEGNADAGGGEPVKMSLMDLLGDTDEQMGWATYMAELEDSDEDEEESENAEEQTCCICMVRHKGTASALCGHTFCRLCSKELMVSRGNCPRCNGFVLEILEIF
uniref:RING-type domain-containing protein n=1 Tax=Kalanchoe fedtschenkoi TaxID=63787 RepID=A0A7N0U960_KALFE